MWVLIILIMVWVAWKVLFSGNPHARLNTPMAQIRHRNMRNVELNRIIKKMRGY